MALDGSSADADPAVDGGQIWLSQDQQRVWRLWIALRAQLPATLNRQLQEESGLSLQDFDVLVRLTDTPDGRCRSGELALALQWERSRVSHHIKRMEARGLVEREECEEDKRGAYVHITPQGRTAIAAAAPQHVGLVHHLMFDDIAADELSAVESYLDRALERLQERQRAEGVPVPPLVP